MVLSSVNSIQSKREYMEDRYSYLEKDGIIVAFVADGHGGDRVADLTAKYLPTIILTVMKNITGGNIKHAMALRDTILGWGDRMKNEPSGSTLTGIVVKNDTVYIFNVGDSHTCFLAKPNSNIYNIQTKFNKNGEYVNSKKIHISSKTFFCTVDHDPENELEKQRIKNSGGKISSDMRLNGILSLTRSLGDSEVGRGLDYTPDVYWTDKSNIIGPILIYSDGIYEQQKYGKEHEFSDDTLYLIGSNHGAEELVKYAQVGGSEDNLTAMVIDLKQK